MSAHEEAGRAGQVIGGKYQLVRCIGRGGMGSVWQAMHVTLGAPVALKLVDPALLRRDDVDPGEVLKRFLREAQAAAAVRSPHVVQILDHGIDGTTPWMALEMLEGESLDQRLARVRVLPFRDTARFITQVSRALTRAHEAGLVHRDLKPSNIFLVRNEDEEIAKILDFGLVKVQRAPLGGHGSDLTAGRVLGTPYYMSPEQAQGKGVDHRTDLWAIGIIAFECVVGRLPFETEVLTQLLVDICVKPMPIPSRWAAVPPGFDEWFAKATHRDASQRFQSAREMAEALRATLAPDETVNVIATGKFQIHQLAPGAPQSSRQPVAAVSDMSDSIPTLIRAPTASSPDAPAEKTGLSVSSDIIEGRFRSQKRIAVGALVLLAAAGAAALAVAFSGGPSEPEPAAAPPSAAPAPAPTPTVAPPVITPEPPASASSPGGAPAGSPEPTQRPRQPGQKGTKDPRLGF